jgi:integrase
MATGKLTKDSVDKLGAGSKDQFLWDEKVRGFGVKVTPAGNKVYLVQYRMGGRGSPTRRYTIGAHGSPWTPDGARDEAKRLLARVDQGINPADDKAERERQRKQSADSTFGALLDPFVKGHLKKKWKKAHGMAERILRRRALPRFKNKPVGSITKSDIIELLDSIPEDQKGARRNAYAVLHLFFAWAVGDDAIPIEKSPLAKVDPPEAPDEREHTLADWELRLAWLGAGELGYPFGPLYRVLMGTGQRREEVAALDWRELNRAAAEWALPSSRAKNAVANTIHLPPLMIAELDAIAGGSKWPRRGLVFTTTGKTSASGYSRAKRRLDKAMLDLGRKEATAAGDDPEAVSIDPFVVHDFRRTMATGMQRLGFRWEVIEACENRIAGTRAKKGSGKVYQRHDWGPEKKLAWEAWSKHLEQAVSGADDTNVVQLATIR